MGRGCLFDSADPVPPSRLARYARGPTSPTRPHKGELAGASCWPYRPRRLDLPDLRPNCGLYERAPPLAVGRAAVSGRTEGQRQRTGATRRALPAVALAFAAFAAGCSGFPGGSFWNDAPPPPPAQPGPAIGPGQVKVGLVLPLSASGNAGLAAQSMKNAAELALSEFNSPNLQLLVKD